jgi:ribosomal protein S18 acetylase RimI-like enzyme
MKPEIHPFHEDLFPQAGELLAGRHRRDRSSFPQLPARFEDYQAAARAVEAAWRRERSSGVAAIQGGQLLGYMIGERVLDAVRGRSAWVRTAGCALAPGQDPELVQDLYATLAAPWVEQGIFDHFSLTPIADPALVQAWFSLSFGIEQVHALLDLDPIEEAPVPPPPGVEIRLAGPEDRDRLGDLPNVIWRHQVKPPVWGIMLPEAYTELQEGWAELTEDPNVRMWLAFMNGKAVGVQAYWPAEEADDDLLIPPGCVHLSVAGTLEEVRGLGIGLALTRRGLGDARAAGYRTCEADWRSTNLLASRFWPKQGFWPVVYRLVRRIDPRIAWARGV